MIKTISIVNHKSFHPTTVSSVRLDHTKTATYMYGLNGAGKSAIGEVVDGISRKDPKFGNCSIETTDGAKYRYLVYNQNFVDRVIGEPMKGIFTVGEDDTARQHRIDEIVAETGKLDTKITGQTKQLEETSAAVNAELERAKIEVWKAHELGKRSTLADLLKGYGRDAQKFFTELRTHQLPVDSQLDSMERLEKRWADVSGTDSEKSLVNLDVSALGRIEADSIWGEPIEVSSTSRLAGLVSVWGSADWVARGREFFLGDHCPFCQQSVPHDFRDELTRLLEGERTAKVDKIASLVDAYSGQIDALTANVEKVLLISDAKDTGLDLAWSELRVALQTNLAVMQRKREHPSVAALISPSQPHALKDAVAKLNALIEDFNLRIRDRNGECSGLISPDTNLGENTRHEEVSDEQATSYVFP